MRELVIASRNHHKASEFKSLLEGLPVRILTLDDFPHVPEVIEDRNTLEGNALKKAREVFRVVNLPTLADDTGLEVHYLNDEPGVCSSRYAGPRATYSENCKKLLLHLNGVPPRRRGARFRCVLAFLAPNNVQHSVEGICTGSIVEGARGTRGFGYDPLFQPAGYRHTFGEMEASVKNSISHRGRALGAIKPILRDHFT